MVLGVLPQQLERVGSLDPWLHPNGCRRRTDRDAPLRLIRDSDGDLYIEIPGKPGWFASASDFQRGKKYVERYSYEESEIALDGPFTVEWDIKETKE